MVSVGEKTAQGLTYTAMARRGQAPLRLFIAVVLAVSFQFIDFPSPRWTEGLTNAEPGCYVWIISMQLLAINLIWQEWRSQTLVRRGSPDAAETPDRRSPLRAG